MYAAALDNAGMIAIHDVSEGAVCCITVADCAQSMPLELQVCAVT